MSEKLKTVNRSDMKREKVKETEIVTGELEKRQERYRE